MIEFSMAGKGNGLLRTLPLRCHKHLLLGLSRSGIVTPLSLLGFGKLSIRLGLARRASKWLDRGGQASKSLRDTWYTESDAVTGPARGRRLLVLSQEHCPGSPWSWPLLCSELFQCSGACFHIFCCWYSTGWSAHERENEEQRMEKELHLQAQPEINELSAPVPRPATMTGS